MKLRHLFLPFGNGFSLNKFCSSGEVTGNAQAYFWMGRFQNIFQEGIVTKRCLDKYLRLVVPFSQVFQLLYLFDAFHLVYRQITMKRKALPVKP